MLECHDRGVVVVVGSVFDACILAKRKPTESSPAQTHPG